MTRTLGAAVVALTSVVGIAYAAAPVLNSSEYRLSNDEIESAKKAAFSGDIEAANRLSEFYSVYENDLENGVFWLKVAAEFGDCKAVNEIIFRNASRHKPDKRQEAYWTGRKKGFRCIDD